MVRNKSLHIRYTDNSLEGQIITSLKNSNYNVSLAVREAIIFSEGYEVCKNNTSISKEELKSLCLKSFMYYKSILNTCRINLQRVGIDPDTLKEISDNSNISSIKAVTNIHSNIDKTSPLIEEKESLEDSMIGNSSYLDSLMSG